ncbi:MAG: hypothetical protein LLG20_21855 [Acidobacteriales bacterium]|nr:hypothetical protein [Terriglobales bacterium]
MRRRRMLLSMVDFALLAPLARVGYGAERSTRTVAVLSSSAAPAYREAVTGVRMALGSNVAQEYFELGPRDGDVMNRIQAVQPGLIVAIGSRATAAAASLDAPVLSAMVLGLQEEALPAATPRRRIVSRIPLEVPPRTVLARLKQLFPRWRRLGVIRGPALGHHAQAEIQSEAAAQGFTVKFAECRSPKEMLEAFRALSGAVDFVLCLPDRVLYQSAPVQALILSSIRARLPLVGFSTGFVSAGALAGLQPDYREIGVQAGESALRFLEGTPLKAREEARVVKTIVNARAMRIFGVDIRIPKRDGELVLVR